MHLGCAPREAYHLVGEVRRRETGVRSVRTRFSNHGYSSQTGNVNDVLIMLRLQDYAARVPSPQSLTRTPPTCAIVSPMFRCWSRPKAVLGAALLAVTGAAGQEPDTARVDPWPGFRGPDVDGVSRSEGFGGDVGLEIAWKRPIGSGYAGIAVGAGIVVTMFADGDRDVIAAYDPESGDELWRVPIGDGYKGHDGSFNGPISTPLVDGDRVIGLSPKGRLFAVDRADGATVWSVDLVEAYGAVEPDYGFGTSPILIDGTLIVGIGGTDVSIAGPRPGDGAAPLERERRQHHVPISRTDDHQRPAAGRRHGSRGDEGPRPSLGRSVVAFRARGHGLPRCAEPRLPVWVENERVFLAFKDEASTVVELDPSDPDSPGDADLGEPQHSPTATKFPSTTTATCSGFSSRFLTAVDARTGDAAWKSRPPGDGFPILVGDDLIILTKNGSLHVIEASPEQYRERAASPSLRRPLGVVATERCVRQHLRAKSRRARPRRHSRDDSGERAHSPCVRRKRRRARRKCVRRLLGRRRCRIPTGLPSSTRTWRRNRPFPSSRAVSWCTSVYRGPGKDVALAGDLVASRQEVPMRRVEGTDLFVYTARLEPDRRASTTVSSATSKRSSTRATSARPSATSTASTWSSRSTVASARCRGSRCRTGNRPFTSGSRRQTCRVAGSSSARSRAKPSVPAERCRCTCRPATTKAQRDTPSRITTAARRRYPWETFRRVSTT